jgi:hypothetical protein
MPDLKAIHGFTYGLDVIISNVTAPQRGDQYVIRFARIFTSLAVILIWFRPFLIRISPIRVWSAGMK